MLRELRLEHGVGVQHAAHQHHEKATDGKVSEAEEPQIDQRIFLPPLPHKETDDTDDEQHSEGADERRGEPVVFFALVQHDLQAAHRKGQERQPHVIHVAQARWIGLDPRRIFDQARDQNEGQDAYGNIDEENPSPGEVVGDPAARRGPDGGREHSDQAVKRESLAALVRLKRVGHDGLRHGLHAAAEHALQHAAAKQDGQ